MTAETLVFFFNKIKFLASHDKSTREDLSIDVSITNVGLILTKLRWFQLKSKFNFEHLKKNQIYGFSIDVWITNVGLISTKARVFLFSEGMDKIQFRTIFEKKNHIFGFPWCCTREGLSIDVSITNVGLILTKPGWFFSGYGQTDTVLESSHGNMSAHKKFQLKAQN